ncbi:MAG: alkene reductase [Cyanobacteria bacterium REEB459]|nr:alkene reductase [Cyanobacteria bacterium REEB459]
MAATGLFSPLQLGALYLPNRIFMAPLTRCRASLDHVPTALMADYYSQRASAGLIIAEATMAMAGNSAFYTEPGIYNQAQIEGWRLVTDAVHRQGGHIFLQLWHGGRACHPLFNNGAQPVAPSPIAITSEEVHTPAGKQPHAVPRALPDAEIATIVEGFRQAAVNARAAGFDGVEVHGANGYLIDSFLRDGSNQRSGPYGGSVANRCRFLLEVLEAVIQVWGADRTGLRISPLNSYNSMVDSDPVGLCRYLAAAIAPLGLAYLHVIRADRLGQQGGDILTPLRQHFGGNLVANLGYTAAEAEAAIATTAVDAVAFGVSFLANPDLPARIRTGAALNPPHPETFYTSGPEGYTDYPCLPT